MGENRFTQNVGLKGVVFIEITKQKTYPLMIIGNTFTSNSGFLYSDALYIRKITDNVNNPDLTQATHFCGGIYMASNTFTQNIGCKETTRGSVLAYCYSSTSPGSNDFYTQDEYLDHQALTGKDSELADKVKFFRTVDFSSYSTNNYVYSYGGSFGTITYNMEQVMVTSNSFTSNYGGNEGAIFSLEGFPYIRVASNTFTNNGNNIPDFQSLYSTIVNQVQSSSAVTNLFKDTIVDDVYLSYYSYKMETILNIDMTNTITLENLSFNNNWVIDIQTSKTTSHSIRVRNMYKSFNCLNCLFTNNKGISNDQILTSAPNTVNFSFLKKGMQSPLINFANYFFR